MKKLIVAILAMVLLASAIVACDLEAPAAAPIVKEEEKAPVMVEEEEGLKFEFGHDVDIFYFGGCLPDKVVFSVKVSPPELVKNPVLFVRLIDQEGEGFTKWNSGFAMKKIAEDEYNFILSDAQLASMRGSYEFMILGYQLVIEGEDHVIIGRSEVFQDMNFKICQ